RGAREVLQHLPGFLLRPLRGRLVLVLGDARPHQTLEARVAGDERQDDQLHARGDDEGKEGARERRETEGGAEPDQVVLALEGVGKEVRFLSGQRRLRRRRAGSSSSPLSYHTARGFLDSRGERGPAPCDRRVRPRASPPPRGGAALRGVPRGRAGAGGAARRGPREGVVGARGRRRPRREGGDYLLDGHKWFVTGADGAGFAIVMAVTDPAAPPRQRATMFLVPTDTPGFRRVRNVPVMGRAGDGWLSHGEILLQSCR